jgi:AcrR family transcriptional regulator
MAGKKKVAEPGGRQAAYAARNRAALLKAGQEVLAEIGPSATIEQLASHAQVSPTTIYKYFTNKDELFIQALGELWHGWISWAFEQSSTTDRFEASLTVARRLFRARETHPLLAQVLRNTLKEMPDFFVQADEKTAKRVFTEFAATGKINGDNFETRFGLWTSIYSGLTAAVHVAESLSPEEADVALGIGLSVWGISEAKAKKILSRSLDLPTAH